MSTRTLRTMTHVALTDARSGDKTAGIFQFHQPEDAASFAGTMRDRGYDVEITQGPLIEQTVPARSLTGSDRLADNVMITRLYFGRDRIRVTGLQMDTVRTVRRSYRYDQPVRIEAR